MTRLISLADVIYVGGIENAVLFSKDHINNGDLIIAQSIMEDEEVWFNVSETKIPPAIKAGYTMYILTKHEK